MSQLIHRARPVRLAALAGIALAAFALVWIGRASADEGALSSPDAASTSVSNVATGRADAVDAAAGTCTNSTDFVDMPGMSETFSFGGNAPRPVLVLFQGSFAGDADSAARIRLLIDGVVQPPPGDGVDVHEEDASVDIATNGFNFISAPLAPGTHTATIQWLAAGVTDPLPMTCVAGRSLIVLHR